MNKGFLESRSVLELYKDVVDDVIRNIRPLFEAEGIDEGVLTQLQEVMNAHVFAHVLQPCRLRFTHMRGFDGIVIAKIIICSYGRPS